MSGSLRYHRLSYLLDDRNYKQLSLLEDRSSDHYARYYQRKNRQCMLHKRFLRHSLQQSPRLTVDLFPFYLLIELWGFQFLFSLLAILAGFPFLSLAFAETGFALSFCSCASSSSCVSSNHFSFSQGFKIKGEQGINGDQGEKGERGEKGEQGPRGDHGDTGAIEQKS